MHQVTRAFVLALLILFAASPDELFAKDVTRTFSAPKVKGVRLDWCKVWGSQCGAPAAALFCRQLGYERAVNFAPDPRAGGRGPTLVFGSGGLCHGPRCVGFRHITCAKAGPPPSCWGADRPCHRR